MTKAIETNKLTKNYGELCAVYALDLEVNAGEIYALLGVNGAGKTTTIKLLTCLSKPTSGTARVMGADITTEQERVKSVTNVSPQETAVAPNLTARENLEFIAEIYGSSRAEAKVRAEKEIAALGLAEIAGKRARTLSGGWKRRLSIAMALVSDPQLLFLDEPTLGLDVLARRELWQVISSLRGRATVILTTHYLEEAEALSDRIGIMAHGRLMAVGTAAELVEKTNAKNFEDAFVAIAAGEVSK